MKDRAYMYLAIALCILASLVDFTSKIMSVATDGVILGVVILLLIKMNKNKA